MAGSTPNMHLVTWDLVTDFFSHTDLLANWNKVDLHNHDPAGFGGVQIPSAGITNGAITNAKIGANAVQASNILNGSITRAKLANPVTAVWVPSSAGETFLNISTESDIPGATTTFTPSVNSTIFVHFYAEVEIKTTVGGAGLNTGCHIRLVSNGTEVGPRIYAEHYAPSVTGGSINDRGTHDASTVFSLIGGTPYTIKMTAMAESIGTNNSVEIFTGDTYTGFSYILLPS